MSEQDDGQVSTQQRPTTNNQEDWKAYWEQQGQPWRTEPEIDTERQKYLAERRAIVSNPRMGIRPFRGVRLSRADIEWLLTTHDNGRGPIDWDHEKQASPSDVRKGLDFRGVDLHGANLSYLPLARLIGGDLMEYGPKTDAEHEIDAMHLEGAIFYHTRLEGATLNYSHLAGANLSGAYLEHANLINTYLEEANLETAQLKGANLRDAHLEKARLWVNTCLEGVQLSGARLDGANLWSANLKGASLSETHLEGANLTSAHLEGAHLYHAFFDSATRLDDVNFSDKKMGAAKFTDVHWGDVNLAVVDWSTVSESGDESTGRHLENTKIAKTDLRSMDMLKGSYRLAARAYRQLSVVLHNQGLTEDAARFAYRAQLMQQKVFWYQRKFGQYLFSLFLDLLAGYGYKPIRSFITYLIVIITFATAYFIIGQTVGPHLSPLGAVVFSMTSFHGRGFFPGGIGLDDPLTVVAAFEAFIGLLIEVTFIATLTQRLFGK
jgi:uncharacterized protein YjbI with pentapeptide repeats